MVRPGAVRRHGRLPRRPGSPHHAVSRLRDQVVQRQPAVRPVHDRAAGRRLAAESDDVAAAWPRATTACCRRRTKAARRTPSIGPSTWPTACGIFPKRGWPARWAAPSATTTSSIRTRRKIFTAWRRSLPTSINTARSSRSAATTTAHASGRRRCWPGRCRSTRRCKEIDAKIAEARSVARPA